MQIFSIILRYLLYRNGLPNYPCLGTFWWGFGKWDNTLKRSL